MKSLQNSPANIIRQLILNESGATFTDPTVPNTTWPLYFSAMADGVDDPDNAGCIYDTTGRVQTRTFNLNVVQFFGIQIKVRGFDSDQCYALLDATARFLSRVAPKMTIAVGANTYTIDTVRQTSTTMSIGQDERRRRQFTVNFLVGLIGF